MRLIVDFFAMHDHVKTVTTIVIVKGAKLT